MHFVKFDTTVDLQSELKQHSSGFKSISGIDDGVCHKYFLMRLHLKYSSVKATGGMTHSQFLQDQGKQLIVVSCEG